MFMSIVFYTRKATALVALLLCCLKVAGQYCIPTSRHPQLDAIISGVKLEGIVNTNTSSPQTLYSYSDFTNLSAQLTTGATYTLTGIGEALFPHNFSAWIDYNHDFEFSADELLATKVIGGNQPLTVAISFTVPATALIGSTRLRVRAVEEPYGPWNLSNDPCLPFNFTGETEDYTVKISGGLEHDLQILSLNSPVSSIELGVEYPVITLRNNGSSTAQNVVVKYTVNNGNEISESIPGAIASGESVTYTFNTALDLSQPGCSVIRSWLEWPIDQIVTNNSVEKPICKISPRTGTRVWYLHSNKNGNAEPLGTPPFSSTTNRVTMNTVFGPDGWEQEYFETAAVDSIFSTLSCLVFLDGSYDHVDSLEKFVNTHQLQIENWVASGGKLFINSSKEQGRRFYTCLGFGNTKLMVYETSHMGIHDPIYPIFQGPYTPVGEEWSGFYAANAIVYGDSLRTVVHEKDDESFPGAPVLHLPTLAEKKWGAGLVLFGTIGASQFLSPVETSMNLRANILTYLHDCSLVSNAPTPPASKGDFSVFPNPTTGHLNVLVRASTRALWQTKVYNIVGQQVDIHSKNSFATDNFTLDLSGLPQGFYYLQVSDGLTSFSAKVHLSK
jgi:hypothetical protein